MASVSRTSATRTGSRREDAVTRNGKTARERALIAAEKAKATAQVDAAKKEETAREQPITVTVEAYDATTGDWQCRTPDGGTVRAQSLTDGALTGLRLPLQRFPGSQTARVNAPPSGGDRGAILAEIEAAQKTAITMSAVQVQGRDPEGVNDARYPGDKWLNDSTNSLFIWDIAGNQWISIGGGGTIIYGTGNPNGTLASQASAVPWVANGQYYDKSIQRLYLAWEVGNDDAIAWVPASTHTFDVDSPANSGRYPGDMYQAPDGAFYRLNNSGNWVMQYVCPDCAEMPEPPPDPCSPGWLYGSGAIAEGATQVYYPCG